MKKEELRIGNWVHYRGEEVQVLGITYPEHQESWKDYRIRLDDHEHTTVIHQLLESIPITEKWLERLGFDYNEIHATWHWNGVIIRQGIDHNSVKFYRLDAFSDAPLKYIHQLQNLYQALTGEELTLKSTT